jgi:hypothetical protein
MFVSGQVAALPCSEKIFVGENDIRGAMVKGLNHLAFIKRHEFILALFPSPTSDGIGTEFLQVGGAFEVAGIVCHIGHARIFYRPRSDLRVPGSIHQDRHARVNRLGQFEIAAGLKNRRSAAVRIDSGDIFGSDIEHPIWIPNFIKVANEEPE